ncbi:MAG: carboxypeptidase M32 [Pirellulaceae bacterium]|nr:carboxypeptidase M32 [Pirellulaceae bacterium]
MDALTELEALFQDARQTAMLEATQALLEWDDRTGLPTQAGAYRAEQITQLSGMIHQRQVAPEYAERLQKLNAKADSLDLTLQQASSLRLLYREYHKNARLPTDLVQALARATVLGQQAWETARHQDDWSLFRPHLQQIVQLKRQQAQLLHDGGSLYDSLLDQYEMGARTGEVSEPTVDGAPSNLEESVTNLQAVFAALRDALAELVQVLGGAPRRPAGRTWQRPIDVACQRKTSRWISEQIGYSFQRGRLDETSHPFCTTLGPHDCRILTRYQPEYFPCGFYGTLHEAGHGLYEQGLLTDWYGLPAGKYVSLGVHESQSRLWENFVGRSQAFWRWAFPPLSKMVGGAWDGLSADDIYGDVNLVWPSLIRVEADEVTYNLHILIRFELEQQLIGGQLTVDDAPEAWNQRYQHYLGINPPSPRDGILQDVHWSAGLIGYFPTYTLGNLYAAQLMQAAQRDVGDLEQRIGQGDFEPLLEWLRSKIHALGACYVPAELIHMTTGQPLSHQPLIDYLRSKLFPLYGL